MPGWKELSSRLTVESRRKVAVSGRRRFLGAKQKNLQKSRIMWEPRMTRIDTNSGSHEPRSLHVLDSWFPEKMFYLWCQASPALRWTSYD
jgi:hypothetical protein